MTDIFEDAINEAKEDIEKADSKGSNKTFDQWDRFMSDGTYKLRIHPEVVEIDGRQKLQLVRTVIAHHYSGLKVGVPFMECEGRDRCRMCAERVRVEDSGYGQAWRFGWMEDGVIKSSVYWSDVADDEMLQRHITEEKPIYLVTSRRVNYAIKKWYANMTPGDLREFFSRDRDAPVIVITNKRGQSGSANVSVEMKGTAPVMRKLFPTPDGMPGILDAFIPKGRHPDDEQMDKIRKKAGECIASVMTISDSGDNSTDNIPGFDSEPASSAPSTHVAPPSLEDPAPGPESGGKCPVDGKNAREGKEGDPHILTFGNHPLNEDDVTHDCLLCDLAQDCLAKARESANG